MCFCKSGGMALARAMEDDPSVVVLGEDVGINGGVFRATVGLQQRFGAQRVLDTPLAELLISGVCVGMATQGLRPVGEIQFMGFIYPCIDQLVNHASRLRNRTQGRLSCPMVLRVPHGGGIRAPEHHSESAEAMLAHIPGLRVVIPSSPERAYGLLLAAIRDPDPVVFLEPTRIYRTAKSEVEDNGEALPLDVAFVLREGRDVTLISWGAMVKETLGAAEALDAEGISAEVIDLATLKPYDEETLLGSVTKTGRCVIVHVHMRIDPNQPQRSRRPHGIGNATPGADRTGMIAADDEKSFAVGSQPSRDACRPARGARDDLKRWQVNAAKVPWHASRPEPK